MYFYDMYEYGGRGLGNNNTGSKYCTEYDYAQCPHDIKFISGEVKYANWFPNPKYLSNNMGIGKVRINQFLVMIYHALFIIIVTLKKIFIQDLHKDKYV